MILGVISVDSLSVDGKHYRCPYEAPPCFVPGIGPARETRRKQKPVLGDYRRRTTWVALMNSVAGHAPECPGRECPFVQCPTANAQWMIQALMRSRTETVDRDRERSPADFTHGPSSSPPRFAGPVYATPGASNARPGSGFTGDKMIRAFRHLNFPRMSRLSGFLCPIRFCANHRSLAG